MNGDEMGHSMTGECTTAHTVTDSAAPSTTVYTVSSSPTVATAQIQIIAKAQ